MDADECLIQSNGSVRSYYWDGDYFKDSYGRGPSPALDYADYYAYFVSSGGGVDNYSDADWDSCGIFYSKKISTSALRTVLMATMRTVRTRMVSSSSVIWVSKIPTGNTNSPSSYRSLSEDGTYWEDTTDIAFYLYNRGDCSDGFYGEGFVRNSYGISLCQEKISAALRSSASTTIMRILLSWMVSSSTTIGISAIPAGIFKLKL